MIATSRYSQATAMSRLLFLGLLSLLVYGVAFTMAYPLVPLASLGAPADIGAITGYANGAAAIYVGSLVVLFALHGLAIIPLPFHGAATPRPDRRAIWIVFVVGVAAALLLSFVYPYGAADIFLYIVRGRVLGIYGLNSSLVPPAYTPTQPYLPFPSEWAAVPSPYGPLWEWVAAGLARLGDGSLASLASGLQGLGRPMLPGQWSSAERHPSARVPRPTGCPAWWRCYGIPSSLLETMAMGHNDMFMVLFVLLAIWFAARSCYGGIYVALTLGALVKYIPLLLVPPTILWMARRVPPRAFWKHLLGGLAVALVVTGLIWWPLWPGWRDLPFLKQLNRGHFSLGIWIILFLRRLFPGGDFYSLGLWITRAAFAVVYAAVVARAFQGRGQLAEHYRVTLYAWLLFGAFAFGYWYITWLDRAHAPQQNSPDSGFAPSSLAFMGLFSVALYTYGDVWFTRTQVDLMLIGGVVVFALPGFLAYVLDRLLPPTADGHVLPKAP